MFQVFEQRKAEGKYEFRMKTPKFNSDTRFENHIFTQYRDFRETYPLLLEVLEKTKVEYSQGDSTEKKKADTADQVQGKMFNTKFALSLSGLCDVYSKYSNGIKIMQTVNMLPTDKYIAFKEETISQV